MFLPAVEGKGRENQKSQTLFYSTGTSKEHSWNIEKNHNKQCFNFLKEVIFLSEGFSPFKSME